MLHNTSLFARYETIIIQIKKRKVSTQHNDVIYSELIKPSYVESVAANFKP